MCSQCASQPVAQAVGGWYCACLPSLPVMAAGVLQSPPTHALLRSRALGPLCWPIHATVRVVFWMCLGSAAFQASLKQFGIDDAVRCHIRKFAPGC